jgi:CRISPR-associated protein Cas2
LGTPKFYVVSYDIVSNKKRNKAADLLKDYGRRVQKSVFECRVDTKTFNMLLSKLAQLIDEESDSILAYVLCEACLKQRRVEGHAPEDGLSQEEYRLL